MTFAEQILQFNESLPGELPSLPDGIKAINPYKGARKELIKEVTFAFYSKYYNDTHPRRMILGSSPARRGSAVTGIPFADSAHLYNETGIYVGKIHASQPSSKFLYDVILKYGGFHKFYSDFYMNFVCPLGLVKTDPMGKETNCDYCDNHKLTEALYTFIVDSIRRQINFGIDTKVCFCIGSSKNYDFLTRLNKSFNFFGAIIPLEHPRYIMQYNSKHKDMFMQKYLNAFTHT